MISYYSLFHLLISEATLHWNRPELRATLGRVFEHGQTKQAADKKIAELRGYFSRRPPEGQERTVAFHLHKVAATCVQAQCYRNEADYNTASEWELNEMLTLIDDVGDAFRSWNIIRDQPVAQAYLVSMLATKERKQPDGPSAGKRPTLTDAP